MLKVLITAVPIKWFFEHGKTKIVNEYDQKMHQSKTADKPMAPRGREHRMINKAKQPALSSPSR